MNNPVAKNCNKFHRAATHTDRKKAWCPELDEGLEEYFEELALNADEIAALEYESKENLLTIPGLFGKIKA